MPYSLEFGLRLGYLLKRTAEIILQILDVFDTNTEPNESRICRRVGSDALLNERLYTTQTRGRLRDPHVSMTE